MLLPSGCFGPHYLTGAVDPSVLEAAQEHGVGGVDLLIITTEEGNEGSIWEEVVTTALRTGFENRGYNVVHSNSEVTLQVRMNIELMQGTWGPITAKVWITASLVDEIEHDEVWDQFFRSRVTIDEKGHRHEVLKRALSEVLTDLFSDEGLRKKLHEYR
jgi:hypothetical protein